MAKHHYAAKFYLDGFCDETHKDPRRKVWVVDLQDQKISRVRPRDCAFVDDLYDASGFEPLLGRDFEKYLSVFESRAAPVLQKLDAEDFGISDKERYHVANYVGLQLARTPRFLEALRTTVEQRFNGRPGTIADRFKFIEEPKSRATIESIASLTREQQIWHVTLACAMKVAFEEIAPLVFEVPWSLLITRAPYPFITSDAPLALLTPGKVPPGGDLLGAFKAKKLQIAFPASPHVALFLSANNDRERAFALRTRALIENINTGILPVATRYVFSSRPEAAQWALTRDRSVPPEAVTWVHLPDEDDD